MLKWFTKERCEMCGLGLIRLALAVVFIFHGWQKWSNMDATVGFFGTLGLAPFFAYLVATVELLSGLAMLFGIWTRWAGYLIAIVMFFAIVLVKGKLGFPGYELELTLFLTALGVALLGPGTCSLESKIKKK
jgi:uncharacterized membrane protein YphA (DoxX/SURF4 family)